MNYLRKKFRALKRKPRYLPEASYSQGNQGIFEEELNFVITSSLPSTQIASTESSSIEVIEYGDDNDDSLSRSDRSSNPIVNIHQLMTRKPLKIIYYGDECETYFDQSKFVLECLEWHNEFRRIHTCPPLKLSNKLCSQAQDWANYLAHSETFCSKNNKGEMGENLFCKWSPLNNFDVTGEEVVKYWYSEIGLYRFDQNPSILHAYACNFTQLIWKSTRELGIGKARTRAGRIIIVANYFPSGNTIGEFTHNVLPICEPISNKLNRI